MKLARGALPNAESPLDADGYARRGAASAERGRLSTALADVDRACTLAPDVGRYFAQRGQLHMRLKQLPEASSDFETALRLDPRDTDARIDRAELRVALGNRTGAIDDLQELDRLLSPQADLRRSVAQLDERLSLLDRSLSQWDLWIASHSLDAAADSALNTRCWLRVQMGIDLAKAMVDCNEALDRQPKNASFLDSRAWLHWRLGETRDALADYDRAEKSGPLGAWSLYGRGLARLRLGDAARGQSDIDAARAVLPTIDREVERHGMDAQAKK